jgi:CRISPR-associated protein Csx17
VEWLDAAIAISSDGSRAFAPVLGTGGNEGRLDYTNNFMERLSELLIAPVKKTPVRDLLANALFGRLSDGLQGIAVGQYDPGRAGGFNQGERIEVEAVANPWNTVLTLEGAASWVGGIYRRQGAAYRSFLCSPFTVRSSAVGYGSASGKDKENARAEIWTPLWGNPSRFREVAMLLREGRASVDGKPAQNGLEFAEAAGMLGVDRGIDAFVRYSLLKRRGDSYIALPAGKFPVQYRSTADLVRELTPFVDAGGRAAKGSGGEIPNSWPPLARAMDEAMFRALLHGRQDLLVDVAAAFGAMHRWLLLRNREVYWRGRLSSEWLKQLWEVDRPEVRIAAGVAAMRRHPDAGALLENLNPGGDHFCWTGADLSSRMLSTLRRRTLDAARSEQSPFWSRMLACPDDAVAFLERTVSDELIENLTFAFVLAEPPKDSPPPRNYRAARRWPAYCVLKQLFDASTHPSRNARDDDPRFRPDLAVSSWLAGGRVKDAVDFGIRRLQIAGLTPVIRQGQDSEDGPRLGAALLIPVWGVKGLRDL